MSPEIRRAALRAAAKAAFVVSIGCSSGAGKPAPSNVAGKTGPEPAAASCAEYLAGLEVVQRDQLADDDPLKEAPELYGAFADRAARESARTRECCTEALAEGGSGEPRWACCSALGNASGGQPGACIPWGPPCPPSMA